LILTAVLLLVPASGAAAEEVYLEGGDVFDGDVLELNDDAVVMSIEGLPGSRVEIPLDRISDYGLYLLKRERIDPASPEDRIALADWAVDLKMHSIALEEYRAAKRLLGVESTPGLDEKLAAAADACGADRLARARKLMEAGELKDAHRLLESIVEEHPRCPASRSAAKILPGLEEQIDARRERERRDRREEKALTELDERLDMVDDLIARGDRMRHLGYLDSGDLADAEDDFLEAIHAYRKASKVLDTVADLPQADARLDEREALGSELGEALIAVYVDVGYNFIVKGNLVRANHYMGRALAIDANDPRALGLRQAIAEATAEDTGRGAR
jgi:tetratricopeptide (TPR) repeat protein